MVEGGPSPGISARPVGSTEQMEEPLGHDPLRLEDYGEGWMVLLYHMSLSRLQSSVDLTRLECPR